MGVQPGQRQLPMITGVHIKRVSVKQGSTVHVSHSKCGKMRTVMFWFYL